MKLKHKNKFNIQVSAEKEVINTDSKYIHIQR